LRTLTTVDVAIVGGGPAASAAAQILGRAGATALIVERRDDAGPKPGESLPPSARPLLDRLGVLDAMAADGHLPCHGNRSVWGDEAKREVPFIATPYGHGWHLHRRRFEQLLIDRATASGAQRLTRTTVSDITRDGTVWRLTLQAPDGIREVRARVLIDATGRSAAMARRLGAQRIYEVPLIAYVWFFETGGTPDPDSFTLVESAPDGWWYSALLPDRQLTVAFMTDPPPDGIDPVLQPPLHTRRRIEARPYRLLTALRVDAGGSRLDRAMGYGMADGMGDGWLAIGDAAAAWDPLSSYGLTAALATGIHAAEAILRGEMTGYPQEVETMWQTYTSMRRDSYATEQRWRGSPFWERRTGRLTQHARLPE
jgi:flavin-dependent dehydrogenase